MKKESLKCPVCKGFLEPGTTTFNVDLTADQFVIRNVEGLICSQCGEEWLEDGTASRLEKVFESDEISTEKWLKAVSTNPVFEFLNDEAEDVYRLTDGQPLN